MRGERLIVVVSRHHPTTVMLNLVSAPTASEATRIFAERWMLKHVQDAGTSICYVRNRNLTPRLVKLAKPHSAARRPFSLWRTYSATTITPITPINRSALWNAALTRGSLFHLSPSTMPTQARPKHHGHEPMKV